MRARGLRRVLPPEVQRRGHLPGDQPLGEPPLPEVGVHGPPTRGPAPRSAAARKVGVGFVRAIAHATAHQPQVAVRPRRLGFALFRSFTRVTVAVVAVLRRDAFHRGSPEQPAAAQRRDLEESTVRHLRRGRLRVLPLDPAPHPGPVPPDQTHAGRRAVPRFVRLQRALQLEKATRRAQVVALHLTYERRARVPIRQVQREALAARAERLDGENAQRVSRRASPRNLRDAQRRELLLLPRLETVGRERVFFCFFFFFFFHAWNNRWTRRAPPSGRAFVRARVVGRRPRVGRRRPFRVRLLERGGEAAEPLARPVRGRVVHNDELEAPVRLEALLRQDARDAIGEPGHGVAARHEDGDARRRRGGGAICRVDSGAFRPGRIGLRLRCGSHRARADRRARAKRERAVRGAQVPETTACGVAGGRWLTQWLFRHCR